MNKQTQKIKLSQVLADVCDSVYQDLDTYNITSGSNLHLKLLYHYTLKSILEIKKNNPDKYITVDNFELNLPDKITNKFSKFINSLENLLPNILQNTHTDPNFNIILMNLFQKSTVNKKNLYKLKKFSKKHGLKDILNYYLDDPSYRHMIYI
jgi:hypothetical protein